MSDSPYREAGTSVEPARCLFCGAERAEAGACMQCGATSRAGPDETPSFDFPCPRCKELLEPRDFGRSIVKLCGHCHGCFVPTEQFSKIVNDYVADVPLPIGQLPPPGPPVHDAPDPRFEKVVCIACDREMDRIDFGVRSGAIVDVCDVHGIWLDAGELVTVLHFMKTTPRESKPLDLRPAEVFASPQPSFPQSRLAYHAEILWRLLSSGRGKL